MNQAIEYIATLFILQCCDSNLPVVQNLKIKFWMESAEFKSILLEFRYILIFFLTNALLVPGI